MKYVITSHYIKQVCYFKPLFIILHEVCNCVTVKVNMLHYIKQDMLLHHTKAS